MLQEIQKKYFDQKKSVTELCNEYGLDRLTILKMINDLM